MNRGGRTKWLLAAGLAVVPALLEPRVARADGTAEIEGLLDEPIVVTASKTAETESSAPGTATVLTSDDLRRFGIHTLQEAIDFLSLGAASSSGPSGAEIGARGLLVTNDHNDHVLLLINGHSVNEPLYGSANFDHAAGIPMELIDHIEVILGPGSVLYGTGAMVGVVNVVTKRAEAFHGVHLVAEGTPTTWGRTAGGVGYEFNLFGAPSEVTAAVEYFAKNGPDLQFGIEQPRFVGQPEWGGTATHSNTSEVSSALLRFKSGNLDVNVRGVIDRVGLPGSPITSDNSLNRILQRWGSIDVAYRLSLSAIVELTTRAYADSAERQYHAVTHTFNPGCTHALCDFINVGAAHWGGLEERASFDWLTNGRFVTLGGVDARVRFDAYKFDHLDPFTNLPTESTVSNVTVTDVPVGAYIQQTWQPAGWLAFNGGLRMDEDPRFPVVFSPRLAATVKPWTGGALKAVYSEAFRAPSFVETDSSSPIQPVAVNLAAEKVRMAESSVEQAFGAQHLRFGVFYYSWTNVVQLHGYTDQELRDAAATGGLGDVPYAPGLFFTQYRNTEPLSDYGFNLGYDGTLERGALRYGLNMTGALARDRSHHVVPGAPQLFGNARVSYDFGTVWPTVALAARYQGPRAADQAFTGEFTPTPYTSQLLELRSTLTGAVPGVKGLSYRGSATYVSESIEPYVVGPQQAHTPTQAYPDLMQNPNGVFNVTLGLQLDF